MNNKVIIKGNKYGISIALDPESSFNEILDELKIRLSSADSFFDSNKQIAVSFEGRQLSNQELDEMLSLIQAESKLNIQYIIDDSGIATDLFREAINNSFDDKINTMASDLMPVTNNDNNLYVANSHDSQIINTSSTGMFYKGTLRSGQKLEADNSIVIIGDVNPGASVVAGGNIVIIGNLTGSVSAGANGNRNCFVIALTMSPIQIQIADIIARSSDKKSFDKKSFEKIFDRKTTEKKNAKQDAMIATVISDHIYVESISKSAIQDIII